FKLSCMKKFISIGFISFTLSGYANVSVICYGHATHTADASYDYYDFTSSDYIVFSGSGSVDALILGGGGGGGYNGGGGGGGGGFREITNISVTQGAYPVVVGLGGVEGTSVNDAENGGPSSFASNSAEGGGAGGPKTTTPTSHNGFSGACGGGA